MRTVLKTIVFLYAVALLGGPAGCNKLPESYGKVTFSSPLKSLTFPKRRVSVTTPSGSTPDSTLPTPPSRPPFQYVGVIDGNKVKTDSSSNPLSSKVTWYKKKTSSSTNPSPNPNWLVRVVNVNKAALLRDMLLSRKLDLYVTYTNSGKVHPDSGKPLIMKNYIPRVRSWHNMWGANPYNHLFRSNSGGSGTRERRMREGVYTDGDKLFVRRYDSERGVNEMVPVGESRSLVQWIKAGIIGEKMVQRLQKKVGAGKPDVVIEKIG